MTRMRIVTSLLVVLAVLALTGVVVKAVSIQRQTVHQPGPQGVAVLDVPLQSVASGVTGQLMIADNNGKAEVTVKLAGLDQGKAYQVHLRAGKPSQPSASFGTLGEVHGGIDGTAMIQVQMAASGATGVPVDLGGIADGDHVIEVQRDGLTVALASIPRIGTPPPEKGGPEKVVVQLALESQVPAVWGRATITERDGRATFQIEAYGLQPGGSYSVRLRAGMPGAQSTSFGLLGNLEGDGSGTGKLATSAVLLSGTGAAVQLPIADAVDGTRFIELLTSSGQVVALGRIPQIAETSANTTGPTGHEAVDRIIAGVRNKDAAGLLKWVQFSQLACGPLSPEGFALIPECAAGEAAGTIVSILPAAACEGYWVREALPSLEGLVAQAGQLYSATGGPKARSADRLFPPEFDHLVVFVPQSETYVSAVAFYLSKAGGIVAFEAGCRPLQSFLRFGDEELPVIWGPAEQPSPRPDPSVEKVIKFVANGDLNGLQQMVAYTQVECWSGNMGAGAPPRCDPLGLAPGTVIDTLPMSSCEGFFATRSDIVQQLEALLGSSHSLRRASVFVPSTHPFGDAFDRPELAVVFQTDNGSGYRAIYISQEQVVAVTTGCGAAEPPAHLVERWLKER